MSAEAPVKLTHNEEIKAATPTLAGSIAATFNDPANDHFSDDDNQFLKFHGSYQQDDRDLRKTGKKYIMMIRGRIPGGVMTAKQYGVFDTLATQYGNNTLRITTRQSIQFHGVVLAGLQPLVKKINECLLSTLAACGDVNRNVMAAPTPAYTKARSQVLADAHMVAMALAPQTKAYHSIWIDGVQLDNSAPENKNFVDPLYGQTYLPRKFKIAFAIPPVNDMDIFTNCLGFIAVVEDDQLIGYNLCVGGGMGRSHGNAATYARTADVIGFFTPDKIVEVAKAVLTIHRDFGDRTDRKHARLKYVVAERGVKFMQDEVNQRAGITLEPNKPYQFTTTSDLLDWHKAVDGSWFLGLFVSMGRVKDLGGYKLKTALRHVADAFHSVEFRLTANQNIILANVSEEDKHPINTLLAAYGVKTENQTSVLHAASMACPSLPTCGLGLAESERALPGMVERLEKLLAEVGLPNEEIIIRSTGCPNGCARPYMAEIAFVGKAPGRYQVWLGGDVSGTRLNKVWKDMLKEPDLETEFRPVFARFAKERNAGERFGDWTQRVLLKEQAATNKIAMSPDQISKANAELRSKSPLEIIRWAIAQSNGRAIVSTNYRPYEAVILHLVTQVQPDIPVLWVDHGYNRPATYKHAEVLKKRLKLNIKAYIPKMTAAHYDAAFGGMPEPTPENEDRIKAFSTAMKLEPFQRGMKELAPVVWLTALRKVQNPNRAGLDIVVNDTNFNSLKVSPVFGWTDADMENYLKQHNLPNEWDYFDPAKADEKRECGLHATWGGKAVEGGSRI